ncbi:MAG: cell division protein ZapD [Parashewanella sp.]
MTEIIFEQPLNEKIRSYLRLEYLADQLARNQQHDQQHACFYPLFSLWELCERCDYRNDVLKDIDRQTHLLNKWLKLPDANQDHIQKLLEQLRQCRIAMTHSIRFGQELKQDRFLTAIKQRFSMPGASCNFDLPQLHHWLDKPWSERQQHFKIWCSYFQHLLNAVKLLLNLTRNTAEFIPETAESGFYQGDSNQPLSLVRVKLKEGCIHYPTISGNRNRFAIHFVNFEKHKHSDQTVKFELAACH